MKNIQIANGKTITNVLALAQKDKKYKKFKSEAIARIKVAEALYKERKSQSLTMSKLAEIADTTPAIISRIEHAEKSVGIDLLARIFLALGKKDLTISFVE